MKNNTKKANYIANKKLREVVKPLPILEKNLVVDNEMRESINNVLKHFREEKSGLINN